MHVFITTYGGAHVALAVPLIRELERRGHRLSVLALTTAGPACARQGIAHRRPLEFAELTHPLVQRLGRRLLERHHTDGIGLSVDESIAYLGESYRELVEDLGERPADERYAAQGLNAFFPVRFLTRVLRSIAPEVVVATDSPRMERAALHAARRLGIPSLCAVSSFPDIGMHYLRQPEHGDVVCVYSDKVRRQFLEVGRDPACIVVTGNPAWDSLADPAPRAARAAARAERGLTDDDVVVLWAEQPEPGNEELPRRVRYELNRICRENPGWRLLVRLHPSSTDPAKEWIPAGALISPRTEPLLSALHVADVVVTLTSTVGYEALLLDKPAVIAAISRFSHLVDYSAEEGALVIGALEELPEAIRTVATDTPTARTLRQNRARLPQAGGAAGRMADCIEGLPVRERMVSGAPVHVESQDG